MNPPLSKPLPSVGSLLSDTWKLFTSTWNTSVKTSILFLYVGLAYFAGGLLVNFAPAFTLVNLAISIAAFIITIWLSLRVAILMLDLEAGKSGHPAAEEMKKAWDLFLPALWVGFLASIVVLGASLLLLLPGIYFGVALYFGNIILIDRGTRGTQALAASRELVKGRWWATFGRLLAGGLLFGLGIGILSAIFVNVTASIAGPGILAEDNPVGIGILQFFDMVILAAFMPLVFGFQAKLYRQLQKTK